MRKIFVGLLFLIFIATPVFAGTLDASLSSKFTAISGSEKITAIVYMVDKPAVASWQGSQEEKIVYLKSFAAASQAALISYLEEQKKLGKATNYVSFWIYNGLSVTATKDVLKTIAGRSDVEKVIPNYTYTLPPEPQLKGGFDFWAALSPRTISATLPVRTNISQIKADSVWTLKDTNGQTITGKGVKIGVVDTGVNASHADLSGKIFKEATFDSQGVKTSDTATDDDGHGTHVCGIVVGGNNSGEYIGVAPDAKLIVARVFDNIGDASYAAVSGGSQWAYGEGAKIINMSLGASGTDEAFLNLVDLFDASHVPITAAIGNSGGVAETTQSPGNVPKALGVGAVDSSDTIADFSSRGPVNWYGTYWIKPDIVAPGVGIKSATKAGSALPYKDMNGTSQASPHVAGVMALMLQANASSDATYLRKIITREADQSNGTTYPNNTYGWGRLNALAAVLAVMKPDTNPPVITHIPVTSGSYGNSITISATITDEITTLPTGILYYRRKGGSWQSSSLQGNDSNLYNAVIPASETIENLYYYIKASDLVGNVAYAPAAGSSEPYAITLSAASDVVVYNVINSPNPFGAEGTNITYYLFKAATVSIRIYDLSGNLIKTLEGRGNIGYNSEFWDGVNGFGEVVSNGIYIYQVVADDGTNKSKSTGKMIILR